MFQGKFIIILLITRKNSNMNEKNMIHPVVKVLEEIYLYRELKTGQTVHKIIFSPLKGRCHSEGCYLEQLHILPVLIIPILDVY